VSQLFLWVALAVVAAIVALGTAASLRFGIWGRRITVGLVVLCGVASNTPVLLLPGLGGNEAHMITSLRALNMAQLLYSTSYGQGSYARTWDDLRKVGLQERLDPAVTSRRGYRIELIPGDTYYAVIAVPIANSRLRTPPTRVFCVDDRGAIFWAPRGTAPVIDAGRCGGAWKPIQ
jgi:hypothetical protein